MALITSTEYQMHTVVKNVTNNPEEKWCFSANYSTMIYVVIYVRERKISIINSCRTLKEKTKYQVKYTDLDRINSGIL